MNEVGTSAGESQTQAGDLLPSNAAMVAAIRALAKKMHFKQAWEVIKSMRPLGYAQCFDSLLHFTVFIPRGIDALTPGPPQVRADGRIDRVC